MRHKPKHKPKDNRQKAEHFSRQYNDHKNIKDQLCVLTKSDILDKFKHFKDMGDVVSKEHIEELMLDWLMDKSKIKFTHGK